MMSPTRDAEGGNAGTEPVAALDARFSSAGANPIDWAQARSRLEDAKVYWLVTVRPDGRPHVTPLVSVWLDGALFFCTGETERKARNLVRNSHCILLTGCNALNDGVDLVVEGDATRVTDNARLQSIADAYETKYGSDWHFDVRDGAFHHDPGPALVYEVAPSTAFGFGKGEQFSQTRWRFGTTSGHDRRLFGGSTGGQVDDCQQKGAN
jgi:general stress protein 26